MPKFKVWNPEVDNLRDPKFYTARTKRAVNSLTIERGPKAVPHE